MESPAGAPRARREISQRDQPFAIIFLRTGLRTSGANPTTTKFIKAVVTNTMCQLPVEDLMTFASGMRDGQLARLAARYSFEPANPTNEQSGLGTSRRAVENVFICMLVQATSPAALEGTGFAARP
jgi:hypothetical protein